MWLARHQYCVEMEDSGDAHNPKGRIYYEYFYSEEVAKRYIKKIKEADTSLVSVTLYKLNYEVV